VKASPRGGNPLHVHPLQEEYFKAVSGTFGVQVGDKHRSEKLPAYWRNLLLTIHSEFIAVWFHNTCLLYGKRED